MSSWLLLVIAGLLECAWAVGLKYTHGFTRPVPSILVGITIVVSLLLLSLAARTLPIGTAYAVWVGIGALGAAILGIVLFHEPVTPGRVVFLSLLVVSIIGLKLTAPPPPPEMTRVAADPGAGSNPPGEQQSSL